MARDILFMLPPGFYDNERREYCPECAEMWGLLSWFPAILESLTIVYVDIEKPRAEMQAMLGQDHQNAPTLVLDVDSPEFEDCGIMTFGDYRFINNARHIGQYYAARFGTPYPRGQ